MAFIIGQKVIYTSVGGKKENATILLRKIDFPNGQIDTFNIKGGYFDYQISLERNGELIETFCLEKELS
ncbi:hypothetical protein [Flavobacterium sp.]|uniref:hypothetical protein n=1 Tax=Flavobacterium sp. TaxID=239 RepID=UPI002BA747F6|nr:hypothetical protein [Flavobacterium sp.]HSD05773.1 hypothetical protein [Flavobacterium sp.]